MCTKNVAEEYNMDIKHLAEDTRKSKLPTLDVGNPMEIVSADDSVHNTILIGASMGIHFSWVWM